MPRSRGRTAVGWRSDLHVGARTRELGNEEAADADFEIVMNGNGREQAVAARRARSGAGRLPGREIQPARSPGPRSRAFNERTDKPAAFCWANGRQRGPSVRAKPSVRRGTGAVPSLIPLWFPIRGKSAAHRLKVPVCCGCDTCDGTGGVSELSACAGRASIAVGGIVAGRAGDAAAGMGAGAAQIEALRAASGNRHGRASAGSRRAGRGPSCRGRCRRRSGRSGARDRAATARAGRSPRPRSPARSDRHGR